MNDPVVAPYGSWSSPMSAALLASEGIGLSEVSLSDGLVYWIESRPTENGRCVVVRADPWSAPRDVTPPGSNVRSRVHEYGGGAYLVDRGAVVFSEFSDQRLYRLDGDGPASPITPDSDGRHRFADGRISSDGTLVLCVRERHEGPTPAEVANELVAVPVDGSTPPRVIEAGRDFYAAPRVSPDGTRLAWLSWDLPNMPFDGCELSVADLAVDGSISNARLVAGGSAESVVQPTWSPTGELFFISDRTGWWNLYRDRDGEVVSVHPKSAEFARPMWTFGASTYAFLADGRIACTYSDAGTAHLAIVDPGSGELLDLDLPYTAIQRPSIAAEGTHIAFVGASPTMPPQVVSLDFSTRSVDVLREGRPLPFDEASVSVPTAIAFPTEGQLTAHAWYYPPTNAGFVGPSDERPPCVVLTHGGPTSEATAEFDVEKQFFTSRGIAVLDVNYRGSSGYGREYRERLRGNWGVADWQDCVNAVRAVAERGLVDGERVAIQGGSAGGYTTLCALTFGDGFAAGASYYGISDLESLAAETHKFESGYVEGLVGPYPEAMDVYRARSPIHAVDRIRCPMILFQGEDDRVVPPSQAEIMVAALEANGLPYAYLSFPGEGHGFRRAESIVRCAEAELSFYAQILRFDLADPIEPVTIENLPSGTDPGP